MSYNPNLHHRRSIRLKGYDYSQDGLYFVTICCQDRICRFGKIENDEMILNEYGKIAFDEWIKLTKRFSNFELDVFQIMPNHIHGIIVLNVGATLAVAPIDNVVAQNDDIDGNIATLAVAPIADNAVAQNDDIDGNMATLAVAPIADNAVAQNDDDVVDDIRAGASPAPTSMMGTVSNIVGAYKSLVTNGCLKIYKSKNEIMGKLWQRNYYEHIIRDERSFDYIAEYIINNPKMWDEDRFYRE